jgi:cyanate permease
MLFLARLFFISTHVVGTPARALLLHQWCAPRHYALVQSVGLSQHSVMLAIAVSMSPLLIEGLGSWRTVYLIMGGLFALQVLAWRLVARDDKAMLPPQPDEDGPAESPMAALRQYPQGWLLAVVMLFLSATWTGMVTFLPTLWVEERDVPLTLGGPLLGFLYYGLIPSGFLGGVLVAKLRSRKLLLAVPALLNVVFALAITLAEQPPLLMLLITGLGLVWVATPAIQVLPFEFPGVLPREVAVLTGLILTFMGVGFAMGPMLVGVVAQMTGSIQSGLIALSLLTGLGVFAGLAYPDRPGSGNRRQDTDGW